MPRDIRIFLEDLDKVVKERNKELVVDLNALIHRYLSGYVISGLASVAPEEANEVKRFIVSFEAGGSIIWSASIATGSGYDAKSFLDTLRTRTDTKRIAENPNVRRVPKKITVDIQKQIIDKYMPGYRIRSLEAGSEENGCSKDCWKLCLFDNNSCTCLCAKWNA